MRSFGSDDLADQVFDLGDIVVGDFDARSGGNFHVDGELSGVGLRKEGPAEKGIDAQTGHKNAQQQRQRQSGTLQRAADPAFIKIQQRLNPRLNQALKRPPQERSCVPRPSLPCSVSAGHGFEKARAEQRDHRHRHDERRQQRQAERERQRGKQKLADAEQERDREEIDHIDQRRGQHRQVHFGSALFRRNRRRRSHFQMPVNVFERDHRVVDHAREGQRQPPQDHGVDGAAHHVENHEGRQRGNGNRQQHRAGGPHAAQEHQNHEAGQHQPDQAFMQHRVQGLLDENGLIENDVGHQLLRKVEQML